MRNNKGDRILFTYGKKHKGYPFFLKEKAAKGDKQGASPIFLFNITAVLKYVENANEVTEKRKSRYSQ